MPPQEYFADMQDHPVTTNTSRRRATSTAALHLSQTLHPSQTDNVTMPGQARASHPTSSTQHEQAQTSQAPATSTHRRTTHRRTPNIGAKRAPHSLNSMDHFLHHDDDRLMGMISAGVSNTTTDANDLDQQNTSYHAIDDDFVQADPRVYSDPLSFLVPLISSRMYITKPKRT